ncbi:methyltransferase [Thomasclavelia ramosa]|uniref:methyltransferase n=1 Tax=Thomasclavelia ramosa TaxID=1547 RepID=UPI0018F210CF
MFWLKIFSPRNDGLNTNEIYRFSRNPMYMSYFIFFLRTVLLTQSIILFIILLLFQISIHWLFFQRSNGVSASLELLMNNI